MDIRQLQAFVYVIDTGSFNDAAKNLFVSVSQISKRIKSLEEELSCKLLDRKRSGIIPTSDGIKIYTHAVNILNEMIGIESFGKIQNKKNLNIVFGNNVDLGEVFSDYLAQKKDDTSVCKFIRTDMIRACGDLHTRKYDFGIFFLDKKNKISIENKLKDYSLEFIKISSVNKYLFTNKKVILSKEKDFYFNVDGIDFVKVSGTDMSTAVNNNKKTLDISNMSYNYGVETNSVESALQIVNELQYAYVDFQLNNFEPLKYRHIRKNIIEICCGEFGIIKRNNLDLSNEAKELYTYLNNKFGEKNE